MTEPNTEAGADKAPVPGSPEYDAAMAALGRQSRENIDPTLAAEFGKDDKAGEKPTKPENVPDKFWDAEKGVVRTDELLKSYAELEKGKTPSADPNAKPDADPNAKPDAAAQTAVEQAGLKWDDLGAKIASQGKLDDTDYEKLAKVGIPKEAVDEFIGLRQSAQDRATLDAVSYVGGTGDQAKDQAAWEELAGWAKANLPKDQIDGYNKMLASPNWKVAVDTLKTLKGRAGGNEPNLLGGRQAQGGSVIGYQSQDEQRADMRNELYNQNTPAGAAFRAQVQEKTRLAAWRNGR